MHVLLVATDTQWTPVAQALDRRSGGGNGEGQGILAVGERVFLRRRHLQHSEGSYHRTLHQAETVEPDLVLHLTRHYGLRDAEGNERVRLPPVDRGLRVGRSANRSEEHTSELQSLRH